MYPYFLWHSGLVSSAFAKTAMVVKGDEKDKSIVEAKEFISKFRHVSENSPQNYLNKVHLLDAELSAAHDKTSEEVLHFKKATSLSNKHVFFHEEALYCERFGTLYSQINSPKASCESLTQ